MKKFFILVLMLGQLVLAQTGRVSWQGWSFDYNAGLDASGLVLQNVSYNNAKILSKASFPVMRVKYDNDVCGPYADILWSSTFKPAPSAPNSSCNGQTLCQRTYTQNGVEWLELGINSHIGEYQIYQAYYFNPQGVLDARVFSRGLQCIIDHQHHAHWLLDFDIDGAENDQVFKGESALQTVEFNDVKASGSFWTVKDAVTGSSIRLTPSPDDGVVDNFSRVDVAVRRFNASETGLWTHGAYGELANLFNNAQNINAQDNVFWYVSHLNHLASEGSALWHASGPRIQVMNNTPIEPPPPPPTPTTNLVNPSFESGLNNWTSCGDSTKLSSVADSHSGLRAMQLQSGGCV